MAQVGKWLRENKLLWIPFAVLAGVAVALLQGVALFAIESFPGSFLSVTGAECVAGLLGIELVLFVVIVKSLDEVHSRTISNPHSVLGQHLRNETKTPPAPPPTRKAWDGRLADIDNDTDKMSKGR